MGLTFGDVVQAHVFLAGDPAKGGKMDFAGMNSSWFKEFGTAAQPNKPARAAFQVAALAGRDALVEIEIHRGQEGQLSFPSTVLKSGCVHASAFFFVWPKKHSAIRADWAYPHSRLRR